MYKQTLPLFLCIFLSACDLIDYHPYDGRLTISERDINDHNIPLIEAATKDKDTIRFVLMGDTQRSYDETEDFIKHINPTYGISSGLSISCRSSISRMSD